MASPTGHGPSTPRDAAPPLDHGAIGNGRVLALISPLGDIDWLCMPRFDSPSVFGALLDPERGGTFGISAAEPVSTRTVAYVPNTNVLRSEVVSADGRFEVIDFAPRIPAGLGVRAPIELVRLVRPLEGLPAIRVHFDPRPDYGRVVPALVAGDGSIHVRGGPIPLELMTSAPLAQVLGGLPIVLHRPVHFVLTMGRDAAPTEAEVEHDLAMTIASWRAWAKTCALPSFATSLVLRSALCLKLHVFEDTGAIIAAATTSIPEALGTERTWDYRYCWLRDAGFVVEALRRLSHLQEGEAFLEYLLGVMRSGPLQPVYGIGGERELPEEHLDHLAGYGGSRPVRIGNAAALQRQNDLMGEMVLCLDSLLRDPRLIHDRAEDHHGLLRRLVEDAIVAAPELDMGIWEFRTMLRPYTFSRAMCWVAVRRGALLAERFGWTAEAARWGDLAERERDEILERGYNSELGFFTQGLDGTNLDAANLLLPTLGLIDARDPRFVSTVDAMERLLTINGLMLRYRNDDDFGAVTSAFTVCTFWWAEALALMGRVDDAVTVFNRVAGHANPLGLFSEDIEPESGRLLGNFPQAYTHVGLIHAAITIGEMLDARDGRVRAWT